MTGLLKRLSRTVDVVCGGLIAFLTLVGIGSVALGVMTRAFGISYSWTEELARYSMIWAVYLGASVATARAAHVRMEMLQPLMPQRAWKMVDRLQLVITLGFSLLVAFIGMKLVAQLHELGQESPLLGVPMYAMYAAIPVSFALMALHLIQQLVDGETVPQEQPADAQAHFS
ncbi:MAG: putative Tripartite ATP-independent periplasmic transporter DctQ component [Ramlibacter sp.]|nr:putative Tripartite ATP-independent periplasmic transporter DctQ component [Ramlibacter sp.]